MPSQIIFMTAWSKPASHHRTLTLPELSLNEWEKPGSKNREKVTGSKEEKEIMIKIFRNYLFVFLVTTILFIPACAFLPEREAQISWVTKEELRASLGSADLVILDVRKRPDWDASSRKISGAIHEDYEQVKIWAPKYSQGKTLALYCA